MSPAFIALCVGMVSGTLSGMFGVGGGLITTPLLRFLTDVPSLVIVATTLASVLPTTVVGALSHLRAGNIEVRTGAVAGAVGGLAAVVGANAASLAGGTIVLTVMSAILVGSAFDMWSRAGRKREGRDLAERYRPSCAALSGVGLLAGFASGFLGVGGGFILVPLFVGLFKMDIKRSVGTSLFAISIIAVPGLVSHALLGNVDVRLAVMIALGAAPAAWVGARIVSRLDDASLTRGFAGLMLFAGVMLFATELGWL